MTAVPRLVAPTPVVHGYHLLVLVTQGLEEVASEYLTANHLVDGPVQVLSQPPVALGEAAVGKLQVQVAAPDPEVLLQLQRAPVVQAVLAFVGRELARDLLHSAQRRLARGFGLLAAVRRQRRRRRGRRGRWRLGGALRFDIFARLACGKTKTAPLCPPSPDECCTLSYFTTCGL